MFRMKSELMNICIADTETGRGRREEGREEESEIK